MRHHHATIVELRPDQMRHHHEISPRDPWNYVLTNEAPPRNHRRITSWPQQNHVSPTKHKVIMHTNLIPTNFIRIPCQTHQFQSINPFTHANSLISCFIIIIQPNMWQTPKNKEENKAWTHSRPVLTQAERPHSGKKVLSLRRAPFA